MKDIYSINTKLIPLGLIDENEGQIDGVPANPRFINDDKFEDLKKSITEDTEFMSLNPLKVYPLNGRYVAIGGNMRRKALEELGFSEAPCIVFNPDTPVEVIRARIMKDNYGYGEWDKTMLAEDWDMSELEDWGMEDLIDFNVEENVNENVFSSNNEKKQESTFIVPPFSVFDTRQGYWQDRKRTWRETIGETGATRDGSMKRGIEMRYPNIYKRTMAHRNELGIGFKEYLEKYVSQEEKEKEEQSVMNLACSVFDPVLSEICCRWFAPYKGANIFDCFAGDTQKGLVFGICGYNFTGIELRKEQVEENNKIIEGRNLPVKYICDDGCNVAKYFAMESQDLLFSCPPYFDLEVYSDLPNDASNQNSYSDFIKIIRKAYSAAITRLKNNRFAVIVVGDVIDKKSRGYVGFVDDVKRIFRDNGMILFNDIILLEQIGSGCLRMKQSFENRRMVKVHQSVLVFYKGDIKEIKSNFKLSLTKDEETQILESSNFIEKE